MRFTHRTIAAIALAACLASCSRSVDPAKPNAETAQTIRCAVVGGLADTGLWQELGERFHAKTGDRIEIAVRGPKRELADAFVRDRCHVIAVHACDMVINLVADGHAVDPQPWARNDFVLVGPANDPADVRGMADAGEALRKIIESGEPLMVHASQGAMEVLRHVMDEAMLEFDPETTIVRLDDRHRQMLLEAGNAGAYTLVGRIPFLNGKIPKRDLQIMVRGDTRLRRPYVVAAAASPSHSDAEIAAARRFVAFLRSDETQDWIASYGRGTFDGEPLFFRVSTSKR